MKEQILHPNGPANHEHSIQLFTRRLSSLLTLRHFLTLATVWCFAWGTLALALRAALGMSGKTLLWGATGIAAALIAAVVLAKRQLPAAAAIRSLLDQQNECGGLLIPVRFAAMNAGRTLDVHKEVENLTAQIETLKEESLLAEAKAEELKDKLDQLAAEASGEDPAKTWEALDHLTDSVEKAAKDAAANAAAKQQQLEKAEALAEGLQAGMMAGGDQMDAKLMTEAMQTLSSMMQGAMKENEALAKSLSPETQEALKNGSLSKEQLKEVAGALSQNKQRLNQQMSKLGKNGQINPNALKGGAQSQKRDNAKLSQFLKDHQQEMSVEEAVGEWCEGGKGGTDRGRGDAPMTWTEGTDEKNAKFKEKTLPPAAVAGLQDSQMVGLSAAAPEVQKGNLAAHGALNQTASGGGSAYTQTILPRHKGAVKRYFDRK